MITVLRPRVPALLFFAFCALATALSAAPAPEWIKAVIAAVPPRAFPADPDPVDAHVLLDEQVLDVGPDGTFTVRNRRVVRIITRKGREHAFGSVSYDTDSTKVKSLNAWIVRSPTDARVLGAKETADVARFTSALELYGEWRAKVINGVDLVEPGNVFAYESVVTERSIFSQHVRYFQGRLPVERASISLNLPPGWTATARTLGREPIEPKTTGTGRVWELLRLPALRDEPLAPEDAGVVRLALDITPPPGAKNQIRRVFDSWSAISAYFTPLYEKAAARDAALNAKAAQLTAGKTTAWEKIRALCDFAQATNYIAITLNASQAGGLIPRDATRVLACNYGDCKDKTTLLRALLAAQGFSSFPVIAKSGNPASIEPDWPSVFQFNHCIIAIVVDESVTGPAVLVHPTFGRLLIFDPTNPHTPAGIVAEEVQGGRALLLAGDKGALIEPPTIAPAENFARRELDVTLSADGAITGRLIERSAANAASVERDSWKSLAATRYRESIERWLARGAPGVRVADVNVADDFATGRFALTVDFVVPTYGRNMRGELLIFRPVVVERRRFVPLRAEKRMQPININPGGFEETVRFALPAGFKVDETPKALTLASDLGRYEAAVKVAEDGRSLVFERKLTLLKTTLPATDYEVVRSFFEKIVRYEQAPVVLAKQP